MDYSQKVIYEVNETLALLGARRLIAALKNARKGGDQSGLHVIFIQELVCTAFNLQFEKIVEERGYQNDMAYAKGFIISYLRNDFSIPWIEIKMLLKRDQSVLARSQTLIKKLDARLPHHRPYCDKQMYFDEKIKQYKKQFKK